MVRRTEPASHYASAHLYGAGIIGGENSGGGSRENSRKKLYSTSPIRDAERQKMWERMEAVVTERNAILAMNSGSSTLKFQVFSVAADGPKSIRRGSIDGFGSSPRMKVFDADKDLVCDRSWTPQDVPDLPTAIEKMTQWVATLDNVRLRAIGHRIVHGGAKHSDPVLITPAVLDELAAYQELAPLHQPNNLAPIRTAMRVAPHLPQVACFDTAFHRGHAKYTDCYALPTWFYEQGVRRYGFHGLSYKYISQKLREVAPKLAEGRVIVAHLGSGASMCALKGGVSVESTMGFTALDGLPMGTRPGQLDSGVVLYLMKHMGMTAQEITDLLYHGAGMKGLSGISGDMRVLLESDDPHARLAVDHFVHRCGLFAGMMAAALGGIDAFVFTAGIGENAPEIRARIASRLDWLGGVFDDEANISGHVRMSGPQSAIEFLTLPTNEELEIARETLAVLEHTGVEQE